MRRYTDGVNEVAGRVLQIIKSNMAVGRETGKYFFTNACTICFYTFTQRPHPALLIKTAEVKLLLPDCR